MRKLLFILFIFLYFPISIRADITCGTTISSPGTYTLEGDKTCSGTWVTVSSANVVVDGANYSVSYGGSSSVAGISISDYDNVTIQDTNLTQGANGTHGVYVDSSATPNSLTIDDIDITIQNNPAVGVYFYQQSSSISGLEIKNCNITIAAGAGQGDGIALDVSTSQAVTGSIHNNTISIDDLNSSRPAGINIAQVDNTSLPGLDIYSNNITILGPYDNNGVILWSSDYITIRNNTITMGCDYCRGILIDGGSDNNYIHSNDVDMNTTSSGGACAGIRLRYGSDNNEFFSNTVNSSDAVGTAFCVRYGERQDSAPNDYPDSNIFHDNIFTGISPVVAFENGSTNTDFYCDTITSTDGGACIRFQVWTAIDPNLMTDIDISNEIMSTTGTAILFAQCDETGQFSDIIFCGVTEDGSPLEAADISDSYSYGGWSISGMSPCPNSCSTSTPTASGLVSSSITFGVSP